MLADARDPIEHALVGALPPAAGLRAAADVGDIAAARERFDCAEFVPPDGLRHEELHVLRFTQRRGASFCRIAVYRSVPTQGGLADDFAAAWHNLVLGVRSGGATSAPPPCSLVAAGEGWTLAAGAAQIVLGAGRFGVALLLTWGGHGRCQSVVAIHDDDVWRARIDAFVAGVRMQAPAAVASLPGRTWRRAAHAGGVATRWTYVFDRDGSYALTCEQRAARASPDADGAFSRCEEVGRWRLADDYLMLDPVQAQTQRCDPAGRALGAPLPLPLEPMAYRQRTQFVGSSGSWVLVLAPVGGRPTQRDGPFPAQRDFPQAYVFARALG